MASTISGGTPFVASVIDSSPLFIGSALWMSESARNSNGSQTQLYSFFQPKRRHKCNEREKRQLIISGGGASTSGADGEKGEAPTRPLLIESLIRLLAIAELSSGAVANFFLNLAR